MVVDFDECDTTYGTPIEAPIRVAIIRGRVDIARQAFHHMGWDCASGFDAPPMELSIITFDADRGRRSHEHCNSHL